MTEDEAEGVGRTAFLVYCVAHKPEGDQPFCLSLAPRLSPRGKAVNGPHP